MSVMRKVLLAMSTSPFMREQATKRAFVRKSVSAFMPGETVEEALAAAATLKPQGINTILTRLGEGLTKLDEAEEVTAHYLDVLDKVKATGLDAQISVKPTQLGLDLDANQCQRNLDRVCEKAARLTNVPVWIDMENSAYVEPTLKLFRASKAKSMGTIPMGRYGETPEYGRVAAFILSDAAAYMTGSTVQVDGGLIRSVL